MGGLIKFGRNVILSFLILIILTMILPIVPPPLCLAQDDIKVYVDGEQVGFPDQKPYINNDNRTLVPVRFVSEALGADVEWLEAGKMVKIDHEGKTIELAIGCNQARIGTEVVLLDTRADIVNNRTMVPLRFVSECLGALVEWDAYMKAVYITTLDKPITPFVGTPMDENTFPVEGGNEIIYGSDKPGAQYMYVTVDQLPVNAGNWTFYNLELTSNKIRIKQAEPGKEATHLLIIQDGVVVAGRTAGVYEANPFIAEYDLHSQCDIALGKPTIELERVNAFILESFDLITGKVKHLVIKNPKYNGA